MNHKKMLRVISMIMLLVLTTSLLLSCQSTPTTTGSTTGQTTTGATTTKGTTGATTTEKEVFSYPFDPPIKLTINRDNSPYDVSNIDPAFHDVFAWNVYKEKTGVELEVVGASSGAYEMSESFLLLLASGDYPDLMQANWIRFPGGPQAAMDDGYIIELTPYQEHFPALMQVYAENPDWYQMVQTDDNKLYNFPYLRGDPDAHTETGMVIRQDWLDALNLEVPTTIDELTEVFRAFKNEYGLASAFTFEMRWLWLEWASAGLSSAYGYTYPFFVNDGEVKFGPLEPGFKEFMAQMAAWYDEQLLDPDFPSINKATVQSKFASGEVGVAIQQLNNVIGCIEANAGTDYKVSGVPSFKNPATGDAMFSHYYQTYDGSFGVAISTKCDDIESAARFLDYLYTEEGQLFSTYGTEGVSYEMVNGEPTFTDYLWNHPTGATPGEVKGRVSMGANYAVIRWAFTGHMLDYAKVVHKEWVNENMANHVYPATTFSSIEAAIVSRNFTNIDTYSKESIAKFVTGQWNTTTDYDAFISQLNSYGVQSVLDVYQAAYDRFAARSR